MPGIAGIIGRSPNSPSDWSALDLQLEKLTRRNGSTEAVSRENASSFALGIVERGEISASVRWNQSRTVAVAVCGDIFMDGGATKRDKFLDSLADQYAVAGIAALRQVN